jgi:hypothetical protein
MSQLHFAQVRRVFRCRVIVRSSRAICGWRPFRSKVATQIGWARRIQARFPLFAVSIKPERPLPNAYETYFARLETNPTCATSLLRRAHQWLEATLRELLLALRSMPPLGRFCLFRARNRRTALARTPVLREATPSTRPGSSFLVARRAGLVSRSAIAGVRLISRFGSTQALSAATVRQFAVWLL